MKIVSLILTTALGLSLYVSPGRAQYMYLDANGDGVNTTSDVLNQAGNTTLDIWLDTQHNKNGTLVSCPDGTNPLTVISYEFILQAAGGTINWGSYTNHQASMSINFGVASNANDYHNGFGGTTYLAAGLYKLGSLVISITSGSPAIHIVGSTILSTAYMTSFGSQCLGQGFDNNMILGRDWNDTGGILTTPTLNIPSVPAFTATFLSSDAGLNPNGAAVADLSGDGRPDLVVADRGDNKVSVILAEGDGTYRTFRPRVDYATGSGPRSVVLADFNGDGKVDIATANYSANTVSVLLGNGNGTFAAKTDFSAGTNPWVIAMADFNNDGRKDIAVTNYGTNTVSVLLGDGSGTLGAPTGYATGGSPIGLTAVEVFSGGIDLIVTNSSGNTVSVLPGNGNGTFGTKVDYATGTNPQAVVAVPLGSGSTGPDLVVANYGAGTISVLLDNGAGGFGTKTDYACNTQPVAVASAFLNGDGSRDVAIANSGTGQISVLTGNTDGSFNAPVRYGSGEGPQGIVASEVNGDGRQDLVVANFGANTVSVLLGNGNGTFGNAASSTCGENEGPADLALGDVNGDGKLDVAVAHTAGSPSVNVALLLGNGNGTFGLPTDWSFAPTNYIALADLGNDGKLDIIAARTDLNNVAVRLGNGDGTFNSLVSYSMGILPKSLAIKDLNGDGLLDLASATGSGVSVRLGLSGGSLGGLNEYFCASSDTRWVVAQDVTGDGIIDLVAANYATANVSVLPGNGNGTFGSRTDYACGDHPIALAGGDLNADGKADLVVVNDATSQVSVLLNTGSGFGTPVTVQTGQLPLRVALKDLNGDGKLDIVTSNPGNANTISVLLGAGDGTFPTRRDFGGGVDPYGLAIGNVDATPLPDVVVTNSTFFETVTTLSNRATVTGITEGSPRVQLSYLEQNRPNPFNPLTVISFTLPKSGRARVQVFDVHGRLVSTLADALYPAGRSSITWGGVDRSGGEVASGVYLYRLESEFGAIARRMVLIR